MRSELSSYCASLLALWPYITVHLSRWLCCTPDSAGTVCLCAPCLGSVSSVLRQHEYRQWTRMLPHVGSRLHLFSTCSTKQGCQTTHPAAQSRVTHECHTAEASK